MVREVQLRHDERKAARFVDMFYLKPINKYFGQLRVDKCELEICCSFLGFSKILRRTHTQSDEKKSTASKSGGQMNVNIG